MKSFGWRQWLVLAAFVVVLAATGLFAVRTVRRAIYWRQHQDEAIRPWMNVGYVAHSYRVPPWFLHQALGLPPGPDRRPLREIARDQGRPVDDVIAILQNAIVHARPPYPRPPDAPPPGLRNQLPPPDQREGRGQARQPEERNAPAPNTSPSPSPGRSP
jgi:hypothetical protein